MLNWKTFALLKV